MGPAPHLPLHHLAQLVGDLLQALVRRARRVLRLQLASRVRQRLHLLARLVRLLLAARLGRLRLLCRLLQRRRLLPRLAHLVLGELDGLLEVLDDLVAVGAQQAFGGILVLHRLGAALAILRTLDCKRLETLRVVASKRLQPGMAAQLAKHLGLGFLEVSEEQRLRALPLVADQVVHGVALDVEEVDQARSVRLRPSTQVFEPRLGLSHEDAHVGLEACTLVLLGGQLVEQAAQHLLVGVRRHDEACKTHVAPHCPLCRMRHVLVLILDLEQRPQRALRLLLEAGLVLADQLNQQRHVEPASQAGRRAHAPPCAAGPPSAAPPPSPRSEPAPPARVQPSGRCRPAPPHSLHRPPPPTALPTVAPRPPIVQFDRAHLQVVLLLVLRLQRLLNLASLLGRLGVERRLLRLEARHLLLVRPLRARLLLLERRRLATALLRLREKLTRRTRKSRTRRSRTLAHTHAGAQEAQRRCMYRRVAARVWLSPSSSAS
eukprot:7391785-Prymnesium_polylepis.2